MSEFKVGDRVAVFGMYHNFIGFDEITRITPTGRIRLKDAPKGDYDRGGMERTTRKTYTYIKPSTPEICQGIADKEEKRDLQVFVKAYRWRHLDLPQLRRLKSLLDEFEKEGEG